MALFGNMQYRRKFLSRKLSQQSFATEATAETETTWLDDTSIDTRRVRFNDEDNQNVKKSVKVIEKIDDPSLWWGRHELKHMRTAALMTAYNNRDCRDTIIEATLSFYELAGKECKKNLLMEHMSFHSDLRGLEQYFVPRIEQIIKDQVRAVLEVQATSRNPRKVRTAATEGSRASRTLAHQLAKHDTMEALKCALTSWEQECIVPLE